MNSLPKTQESSRQSNDWSRQKHGAIGLTLVVLAYCLFARDAAAEPVTQDAGQSLTAKTLDVDFSLLYSDDADTLGTALSKTTDNASGTPRALGLKRFKLGVGLFAFSSTELRAEFRPDALLTRGIREKSAEPVAEHERGDRQEFDGRIASPYRQRAALEFLDTYELRVLAGPSFAISAGIAPQLGISSPLVESPLEFGMLPPVPEKSFQLELTWNQSQYRPIEAALDSSSATQVSVVAFQGHQDRSEQFVTDREARDAAPGSSDPYVGVAIKVGYHWRNSHRFFMLAGFADNSLESGKSSEEYYEIDTRWQLGEFVGAKHTLQSGARATRESFQTAEERLSPLLKWSARLQWLSTFAVKHQVFVGGDFGVGEVYEDVYSKPIVYQGRQAELGYRYRIGQRVFALLSLAQENRRAEVNDDDRGGFTTVEGSVGMVRRFAFELRYLLHGEEL